MSQCQNIQLYRSDFNQKVFEILDVNRLFSSQVKLTHTLHVLKRSNHENSLEI